MKRLLLFMLLAYAAVWIAEEAQFRRSPYYHEYSTVTTLRQCRLLVAYEVYGRYVEGCFPGWHRRG